MATATSSNPLPVAGSMFALPGLDGPAEILLDPWGIAHIRAGSKLDAYRVQGFNAARDRLWQLDLWRKRGLGMLAEDFGPGYIEQDRAARLFLYRGDMAAEWAAYTAPDSQAIAQAFVSGINAYVAHVLAHPESLPPEFSLLGTRPALWAAEDVVRIRSHSMMRNVDFELKRASVMAHADASTDLLRRSVEPACVPHVAPGLDLAALSPAALDTMKLACASVTFSPARLNCSLAQAHLWRMPDAAGEVVAALEADAEGSNNWAISGSRTATGRPILASDPHRAYPLPSLRYLVHLDAPGVQAIGAGEPCQPGICIGHNGRIAFGLTMLMMDQEDLMVYELDPEDDARYRYGDGWETMQIEQATIAVRGAAPQLRELRFTRHGPVTFIDRERRLAYAVCTVWTEPGSAPYFNSLAVLAAQGMDDYRAALAQWSVPGVSHVYADTQDRIAWQPAGKWPRRDNWDGLLPVPGDGRYEWRGFKGQDALPASVCPVRGFVASANENKLPPGAAWLDVHLGYEWAEDSRAARIDAVLDASNAHTVAGSMALQGDTWSRTADRLCRVLRTVPDDTADGVPADDLAAARAMLAGWDGRLAAESSAAALFEVWWSRFLRPGVLDHFAKRPAIRALLEPGDVARLLGVLDPPANQPVFKGRDALMRHSLAHAWAFCQKRLGPTTSCWTWGALHHGYFEHAVGRLDTPSRRAWDAGPYPLGGSVSTVMNTAYRASDFRATFGATVRLVMDVGKWDNSVAINAPGQSGDPGSPHYSDLAERWSRGQYVPLLFTRSAVDAACVSRIMLTP